MATSEAFNAKLEATIAACFCEEHPYTKTSAINQIAWNGAMGVSFEAESAPVR